MSIKTEIYDKCKDVNSRKILLAQLALINSDIKTDNMIDKADGDTSLAIRSALHWRLHALNSGGSKLITSESVAGLIGLILVTRAWEGYKVATTYQSSVSFRAFLAENQIDIKYAEFCLSECARDLLVEFQECLVMSPSEVGSLPAGSADHQDRGPGDNSTENSRKLRQLKNLAKTSKDPAVAEIYEQYISGEISMTKALRATGLKESMNRDVARRVLRKSNLGPNYAPYLNDLPPEDIVTFALNYMVEQFKDGVPPELVKEYVHKDDK